LTVTEIQGLLSDDEALVLFASGDKETYVFAVTRTAVAAKVIPLGASALSEKVTAFRRGLDVEALRQSAQGGKPVLFDLGLANELYAALIGPVEDVVKDARHLLVVPSGALTSLPFLGDREAANCHSAAQGHRFLSGRPLAPQAPGRERASGAGEPQGRAPGGQPGPWRQAPGGVCRSGVRSGGAGEGAGRTPRCPDPRCRDPGLRRVLAGSGHRAKLARYLPSLFDTADELKAVGGKLGAAAVDLHLRSDASETVVKRKALADYRVVYFATHGLVAGDVAGLGEPSLALTLPKQPTELDDGLLTASEVAQLKLCRPIPCRHPLGLS
jgi:hypothetical protein